MGYAWTGSSKQTARQNGPKPFVLSTIADAAPAPHGAAEASPAGGRMVDIGSLARDARLRRCRQTLGALWEEVFSLRSWFFVAEPTGGAERRVPEVRPLVVEREGRRRVLVFTDELSALQHERRTAGGLGVRDNSARCAAPPPAADGQARPPAGVANASAERARRPLTTLEVGIEDAMVLLERLSRDGVFAATFDDGQESFEAPLGMLRSMRAAVRGARTAASVGSGATMTGSPAAGGVERNAGAAMGAAEGTDASALDATISLGLPRGQLDLAELVRHGSTGGVDREIAAAALLRLDDWWFICNPRDPDAIYIRRFEGSPAVMAFADERRAIMATERHGLIDADGCILLLQLSVRDSVNWIQSFREQGVHEVAFEANGAILRFSMDELLTRWMALMGESPDAPIPPPLGPPAE